MEPKVTISSAVPILRLIFNLPLVRLKMLDFIAACFNFGLAYQTQAADGTAELVRRIGDFDLLPRPVIIAFFKNFLVGTVACQKSLSFADAARHVPSEIIPPFEEVRITFGHNSGQLAVVVQNW